MGHSVFRRRKTVKRRTKKFAYSAFLGRKLKKSYSAIAVLTSEQVLVRLQEDKKANTLSRVVGLFCVHHKITF